VIVFFAAVALGRSGVTRIEAGGVETEAIDVFNPVA
jgi:hypothetical protein